MPTLRLAAPVALAALLAACGTDGPPNPYRTEWQDLMDAIRNNTPYNEVPRGVQASLVTSMGRMAVHTGQVVSYDELIKSDWEAGKGINEFTSPESDPPVKQDANGKYPIPDPGNKKTEY